MITNTIKLPFDDASISSNLKSVANIIQCKCGCGGTRLDHDPWGKKREYIHGHNTRGWKGGRYKHEGYWFILKPEHHEADKYGYVREHRFVYEEYHKCCLLPWAEIHHKNKKRWDNRPENLEVTRNGQHQTLHKKDFGQKCEICGSKDVIRNGLKNNKQIFQCKCGLTWRVPIVDLICYEKYESIIE